MADINQKKEKGIRKIYNPSDEEKETIRFVYERKRAMEESQMRQQAQKTWDSSMKQWEAMREERTGWQSNHYVPLTQAAVETALSEVVEQTPRPYLTARGSEDVPKVGIMQKAFDYNWECADGDLNTYDVLKGTFIKGTAVAQEYYWQDRRIVQTMEMKNEKPTYTEHEVIDYDDNYMENVRLEDFFVDEFARGFEGPYQARDCIRRYVMNIEDIPTMFSGEIWDQFGNVKNGYVRAGGDIDFYEYYKPPQGIDTSKQVEVLWYWSIKPKDWLIIVINDVLVRKSPNPYKHKRLPFVRNVAIKRPDSFYGKGLADVLESVQDETNTIRRMTIDRSHLDIDKMFLVSSRLSLSDEDLIARPHGAIPVDDVNGSKPVEYGDVPRSVEITLKHLEDDATIGTGINPRAQALPQAGTATEASILKESTLKRLRLMIWLMKYTFLIPLARLRVSNIIQFYQQPRLEEIVGDAAKLEHDVEVGKLKERGLLVESNGKMYAKKYREIPLENQQVEFDEKGMPNLKSASTTNFFELEPKFFVPVHKQLYNVKFNAGSTLQVSETLEKQQMIELFDRAYLVAKEVPNSYDPVKLMDMVINSYRKNPSELKPDAVLPTVQEQRLQQMVQLATMENKMMMQGKVVPATAYASPPHTQIHIEFMNSEAFQASQDPAIDEIFTNHVVGEIAAQESRSMAGAGVEGGGGATTATSVSQGVENRPGGMAKPEATMKQVMPDKNTGQAASV